MIVVTITILLIFQTLAKIETRSQPHPLSLSRNSSFLINHQDSPRPWGYPHSIRPYGGLLKLKRTLSYLTSRRNLANESSMSNSNVNQSLDENDDEEDTTTCVVCHHADACVVCVYSYAAVVSVVSFVNVVGFNIFWAISCLCCLFWICCLCCIAVCRRITSSTNLNGRRRREIDNGHMPATTRSTVMQIDQDPVLATYPPNNLSGEEPYSGDPHAPPPAPSNASTPAVPAPPPLSPYGHVVPLPPNIPASTPPSVVAGGVVSMYNHVNVTDSQPDLHCANEIVNTP